MPFNPGTKVDRGDVVQIVGPVQAVERAAKEVGYADRATEKTDVVFMGLGIVIGALDWRHYHPLRQGAAQPEHQRRRADGGIGVRLSARGESDLRAHSGARALGVQQHRPDRLHRGGRHHHRAEFRGGPEGSRTEPVPVGRVCHHPAVRRRHFHAANTSSRCIRASCSAACAGARTTTAALGAIQDEAQSKVPALGYTITYAVGNVLLITWGVIIVLLMK